MIGLLFLVPAWWPALLLLPWLVWRGLVLRRRQAARVALVFGRRERALVGARVGGRRRAALGIAAGGCVALALLQPIWGEAPGEPTGPDVVVCLDVSRSMLARDVPPSRLGMAQQELLAFAGVARGARCGLVAYAGEARLVAPLSTDVAAVAAIAATMDPSSVARPGSDLGAAIDAAAAALQRAGGRAGTIVVLGDGEDFVGQGAAAAARARAAGHAVDCVGFGSTRGSKIVVDTADGETFLRDGQGQHVVTARDDARLDAVAAAGGGRFEPADAGVLLRLHEQQWQPRAAAQAIHDPQREQAHRFQWPLLAALLLWMLQSALPERRR